MKRLLFTAHRVPYPPDKGERVRAFHEIIALGRHFRVTVACLAHHSADREAARQLERHCEKVLVAPAGGRLGYLRGIFAMLRGRSVTEGFFANRSLTRALDEEASREPFDVVLGYSSSILPYVLGVPAKARLMDLVDVDSEKWASYASSARWPLCLLYRREAAAVRALEREAVECCDAVALVSEAEVQALGVRSPKVHAIGNGVDTEYFKPTGQLPAVPPSLVFTGTMDYRPNVEGVCWFVREVWPELRRHMPGLTFTIVGRDPAPAVCRLAETPGVRVTGAVPDVRPYLEAATAAVVPLQIARGIQNKILEAMALGRPVIASSAAIAGLDVSIGTEILAAKSPSQWATEVTRVLTDLPLATHLGHAARQCVEQRYAWSARMAPLVALCERLPVGRTTGEPVVLPNAVGLAGACAVPSAGAMEGHAP